MSDQWEKIMLTALAEKIKFIYKFLQFYQVLVYISFHLNVQGQLAMSLLVEVQITFLCFEQTVRHAEYII